MRLYLVCDPSGTAGNESPAVCAVCTSRELANELVDAQKSEHPELIIVRVDADTFYRPGSLV